ncbi:MAG: TetR/AcrR family transcriptional regulator [Bryobacteraceae bacterium]
MATLNPKPGRTKKEVVTEFRCKSILGAARAVFARKGFSAALVDDIADEAGIAKGTVYLYFRSKEEIYLAALVEDLQRFHEQTLEAVKTAQGARQKIRAFAEVGLENCRTHRDFLRIFVSEFHKPKALAGLHRQRLHLLASILEEGIQAGEIRPVSVPAAAAALFDIIRGSMERQLLDELKNSPGQDLEFILDLIWTGVGHTSAGATGAVTGQANCLPHSESTT